MHFNNHKISIHNIWTYNINVETSKIDIRHIDKILEKVKILIKYRHVVYQSKVQEIKKTLVTSI